MLPAFRAPNVVIPRAGASVVSCYLRLEPLTPSSRARVEGSAVSALAKLTTRPRGADRQVCRVEISEGPVPGISTFRKSRHDCRLSKLDSLRHATSAIFAEAETWDELRANVLEATSLHFEDAQRNRVSSNFTT